MAGSPPLLGIGPEPDAISALCGVPSPCSKFHTLVLTAGFNVSWNNRFELAGPQAQLVRDQFCSSLQAAMGRTSAHCQPVHLYVNGLYWGLYNLHERPDENFAATYFDGLDSQYDVVRNTAGHFEATAGDTNADGYSYFLIGSPALDATDHGGFASEWAGSPTGPVILGSISQPSPPGLALGRCVASAGDLNGDGFSDVAIGEPYASYESPDSSGIVRAPRAQRGGAPEAAA